MAVCWGGCRRFYFPILTTALNLVSNFELLNPGRNYFGKYYDVFAAPEKERERFLEFEKWWGGYQFLNEQETQWIVEELFIGNKLARGEARLEHGVAIDLKRIRSPIVVFASFGDNITPPQQALNWILDTYVDEEEIKILGKRIVYMVHDKVGHLGIFVSSSIAKKEHAEVTSTVETIEDLPPGPYEMTIDEVSGEGVHAHFTVGFHDRVSPSFSSTTTAAPTSATSRRFNVSRNSRPTSTRSSNDRSSNLW